MNSGVCLHCDHRCQLPKSLLQSNHAAFNVECQGLTVIKEEQLIMRGYAIGSRQIRHVFGWPTSAQQLLKCSIRNVRLIRSRSTVNDVRAQSQLGTIEQAYHDELSSGLIQADSFQAKIVARLQSLDDHLDHYEPAAHSRNRFWTRLFRNSQITSKNQVRGLYVHGTVGCGKTMLMDMFFHNCRVSPDQKHRTHFHAFMLDVHSSRYSYQYCNINVY